jgi:hypothetical protein
MSLSLMSIAAGHFMVAVITQLNQHFVKAKGASQFYFYAVIMVVATIVFAFCASRYRQTARDGLAT